MRILKWLSFLSKRRAGMRPTEVRIEARTEPTPGIESFLRRREAIASRYLMGEGIEIGALHMPLRVPVTARVKYLDRLPLEGLRGHYPELTS